MDLFSKCSENLWLSLSELNNVNSPAYFIQNDHGFDEISYSDFFLLVKQTQASLKKIGIQAKEFVPIYALNDINTIKTLFALWLNGSIPVLINSNLTTTEKSVILSQFDYNFLLCNSELRVSDSNTKGEIIFIDKLRIHSDDSSGNNETNIDCENDALVIFTSGTSTSPKGVVHKFKSLIKSYDLGNKYFNYSSTDKWLLALPIFHIGGFQILMRAFLSGGSVVIPKSLNTNDLQSCIESLNPNYLSLVSTQFKRLLESNTKAPQNNFVLLGGGKIESELINKGINSGWNPYKVYGSSETAAFISVLNAINFKKHNNSAGELLSEVEVEILFDDVIKSSGEILIKSPTLFDRYLNNEEETSKRLLNGRYHSGDFGYLMDDLLFIVNRRTDIIISGGENINPHEIEEVLSTHPEIKEVCIIGVPDKEWGEIVCAVIVLPSENSRSKTEIKNFLKSKLTRYKIPKKIYFMNELPKTELGKIKRTKLSELIAKMDE